MSTTRPLSPLTRRRKMLEARRASLGAAAPNPVPIGPVIEHIIGLEKLGWSIPLIAHCAGLPIQTVNTIRYDRTRRRALSTVATAILGVRLNTAGLADHHQIPAAGAHRRIQALARLGWASKDLAERIGMGKAQFRRTLGYQRVTVRTHRKIAALYDQLSCTEGPAVKARDRAAKLGWALPAAWDDDTIDDPTAEPFGMERAPLTDSQRREAIVYLASLGMDVEEIAREVPCHRETVRRELGEAA